MNTHACTDLSTLLCTLSPQLHAGVYVYAALAHDCNLGNLPVIATFKELEGLTVITAEDAAHRACLPILLRVGWITLKVHSDLEAVGLTAAVAQALTHAGISCNVMAAAYHDHLFVPYESAPAALAVLENLQHQASLATTPVG